MSTQSRAVPTLVVLSGAVLGSAGCAPKVAPPEQQYILSATMQDLMQGLIDPSADALWESVAFIATPAGTEDRQPHTEADWQALRLNALTLAEAGNLLSMPGRRVASDLPGSPSPGPGELSHAEIQQRVVATHEEFVQFARNLQHSAQTALAAIDARDAQALMAAGGSIDEACEACHVTYWYPKGAAPEPK